MTYNVSRYSKDGLEKKKLSKNKKQWLPLNFKGSFCVFTEVEADEFINQQESSNKYYFLKTIA